MWKRNRIGQYLFFPLQGIRGPIVTITQEECLSNAHDFERWAKQACSESDRATFVAMASLWAQLARNAASKPTSDNVVNLTVRKRGPAAAFDRSCR